MHYSASTTFLSPHPLVFMSPITTHVRVPSHWLIKGLPSGHLPAGWPSGIHCVQWMPTRGAACPVQRSSLGDHDFDPDAVHLKENQYGQGKTPQALSAALHCSSLSTLVPLPLYQWLRFASVYHWFQQYRRVRFLRFGRFGALWA